MAWQLQEAKQRLSEVVHRAEVEGPQVITRHGREVAVIVDWSQYRHLADRDEPDFRSFLRDFPRLDDASAAVFDELAAERAEQLPRRLELGA